MNTLLNYILMMSIYAASIPPLMNGGMPAPPPMFREYPVVVGSPVLVREVNWILKVAPELRGRVSLVIEGPTLTSMDQSMRTGEPIDRYKYGVYSRWDQSISIAYGMDELDLRATLAHEMAHAGGLNETQASAMSDLLYPSACDSTRNAVIQATRLGRVQ